MSDADVRRALYRRTPLYNADGVFLLGELVPGFCSTSTTLRDLALQWSGVGAELRPDELRHASAALASLRGALLDAIEHAEALHDALEAAGDERRATLEGSEAP